MRIPSPKDLAATAAAVAITLAPAVTAQTLASDADIIPEISRDAVDLRAVLVPRPDLDTVNTALVFTSSGNVPTIVVCAARDADGNPVGRAKTEVPAHGVRLILASDLSNGADYVGSATCKSRRRLTTSAFVIGADLSDAPSDGRRRRTAWQMDFPIIASF